MSFGEQIHDLWRMKLGLLAALALALLAAVWSVAEISVLPPSLKSRSLDIATASTSVVVDTPKTAVLDLRQDTYAIQSLRNRAVLLGTVMASTPVREYIARRAHVPPEALRVVTPRTPDQPRARFKAENQQHVSDIFKANDEYRLDVEANPTVPILDLYTQAPTADAAENLANAAVDGLHDYLTGLALEGGTVESNRVRLTQLGRARGGVINKGVGVQLALISFAIVFAVSCAAVLFFARVGRGWRIADLTERAAAG
jgi:hypothetical protein